MWVCGRVCSFSVPIVNVRVILGLYRGCWAVLMGLSKYKYSRMVNVLLHYQNVKLLGAATTVQRWAAAEVSFCSERTCRFRLPFGRLSLTSRF